MEQILTPAIKLAEDGVPIPQKSALCWDKFNNRIKNSKQYVDLCNKDRPPLPGEKIYVPKLAQCLKVSTIDCYFFKFMENILCY